MKNITRVAIILLALTPMLFAAQTIPVVIPQWARTIWMTQQQNEITSGIFYQVSTNTSGGPDLIMDTVATAANVYKGTINLKQTFYNAIVVEKVGLRYGFKAYYNWSNASGFCFAMPDSCPYITGRLSGTVNFYSFDSTVAHTYYIIGHPTKPQFWSQP